MHGDAQTNAPLDPRSSDDPPLRPSHWLRRTWSATEFEDADLTEFARKVMITETRYGLVTMCAMMLGLTVAALVLHMTTGAGRDHFLIYGSLAALSLHILLTARLMSDVRTLHMLGTVLLVVSATAYILLAHRTGELSAGLLASIVLLIIVTPTIPWGLRDATMVVTLSYLLLSLSSVSVNGRFDADTLLTLQFLLIAAGSVALTLVARNADVRKQQIAQRFELERAHREMELLSTRDPLTGCWNRRFLQRQFSTIVETAVNDGLPLQLALLDIDDFKALNDNHGHQHGDRILKRIAAIFHESLPGNAYLIRLGGDEFAIVTTSPRLKDIVQRCLDHLATDPGLLERGDGVAVAASVGFAAGPPDAPADLDTLYREADEALYRNKRDRARRDRASEVVAR